LSIGKCLLNAPGVILPCVCRVQFSRSAADCEMVVASAVNDEGDQIYPAKVESRVHWSASGHDQSKRSPRRRRVSFAFSIPARGTGLEAWRWSECVGLLEEVPLPAHWLSLDFLVRTLLLFLGRVSARSSIFREACCSARAPPTFGGSSEGGMPGARCIAAFCSQAGCTGGSSAPRGSALEITVHLLRR